MPSLTDREDGSIAQDAILQNFNFSPIDQTCLFEAQITICLLQYLKDIIS